MRLYTAQHSYQKPWFLLFSLYITQYIGVAFFFASAVVILRNMGMALDKLALINIIALPLLLKVFFAPFVDSIQLSFLGKKKKEKYRGWLLFSQFIMAGLLIVIGSLNIIAQFEIALTIMTFYVFVASIQDIAVDGITFEFFDESERQYANSVQFSGNLVGNILGGGVILLTYSWLGWQGSLWLMALLTAISWLQLLFLVEPTSKDEATHSIIQQSLVRKLALLSKEIVQFIKQHSAWFGLLMIYSMGISFGFALLNPLLVDAKWAMADIGMVMKMYGSIVGIASAIAAGALITKVGRLNALYLLTALQAVALLSFLPLSYGYTSKAIVYTAVGLYYSIYPALMTTIATIMMDKASTQSAKATFFTLQISILTFMGFVYASLSLVIAKYFGYSVVILSSCIITLLVLLLVRVTQTHLKLP